jgi:serine protease
MLWAAGVAVNGVSSNPNPAKILNMSLGGEYECGQAPIYQQVIDQVNAAGAIIVVAAGNENMDATKATPASCSGVITVGATDFAGARAPYSNFGSRIDVMAPGGNTGADLNNDQFSDGVLSLNKNDASKDFNFIFENGTSMAAPHVAGVIALMKSRDPSLTYARALEILKRTARVLSSTKCTGSGTAKTSNDCGAGLIDAQAALQALGNPNAATPEFTFAVSPSSMRVQPGSSVPINVSLERLNGFTGDIAVTDSGVPIGVTASEGAGNVVNINVAANVAEGTYPIVFTATSGAVSRRATLSLNVQKAVLAAPTVQNTAVVACFYTPTDACNLDRSGAVLVSNNGNYTISNLEDGNYFMVAWKDINNNEEIDDADLLGLYIVNNDVGLVRPNSSNINIQMTRVQQTSRTGIQSEYGFIPYSNLNRLLKKR